MSDRHRSGRWVRVTLGYLYQAHGHRCGRCLGWIDPKLTGMHPLGGTIGHVVPLSQGGTDHLENLRPEHRRCNLSAGRRDVPVAVEAEPVARPVRP
jgi:5-methylcytosine-specific restriction endonuclease McrA